MRTNQTQVVVAFDFTNSGRAALYRALTLAAQSPSNVLHFVCVIEPHGSGIPSIPLHGAATYQYAERVQQELAEAIPQELAGMNIATHVHYFVHARIGKPADEILQLAREVGADQIIVGTKGVTGVERLVLGSVAERVVREARCSVEVARAKTYDHVALLEMTEVQPHGDYVRPHRYSYSDHRAEQRPLDWPLY